MEHFTLKTSSESVTRWKHIRVKIPRDEYESVVRRCAKVFNLLSLFCFEVGFLDPRELSRKKIVIKDPRLKKLCGAACFYSITFRCFKLPAQLERTREDYGQIAFYKVRAVN